MTRDPNEYDSFMIVREKVKNRVNSLDESWVDLEIDYRDESELEKIM